MDANLANSINSALSGLSNVGAYISSVVEEAVVGPISADDYYVQFTITLIRILVMSLS